MAHKSTYPLLIQATCFINNLQAALHRCKIPARSPDNVEYPNRYTTGKIPKASHGPPPVPTFYPHLLRPYDQRIKNDKSRSSGNECRIFYLSVPANLALPDRLTQHTRLAPAKWMAQAPLFLHHPDTGPGTLLKYRARLHIRQVLTEMRDGSVFANRCFAGDGGCRHHSDAGHCHNGPGQKCAHLQQADAMAHHRPGWCHRPSAHPFSPRHWASLGQNALLLPVTGSSTNQRKTLPQHGSAYTHLHQIR